MYCFCQLCPTAGPAIQSLTQSLHVACSMALQKSKSGILYLLGFEELTPTMTFSHYNRSLLIRLASAMPEIAKRPLYQEGYLVSNFPAFDENNNENFANRLLAKFSFKKDDF